MDIKALATFQIESYTFMQCVSRKLYEGKINWTQHRKGKRQLKRVDTAAVRRG